MDILRVGYIGSSYKIAEYIFLSQKFELNQIFCENNRVNKDIILFSELYNVKLTIINSIAELENEIELNLGSISFYIMYNFGLIISDLIISKTNVFNIHSGNLNNNRGRNPIERCILNNERWAEISIYQISNKLDLGLLIYSEKVNISLHDDSNIIRKKLENKIPKLLNKLFLFRQEKKGQIVSKGEYYKRISEADFTLNLEEDTIIQIFNKIRSQLSYNGAILLIGGEKYHVLSIKDIDLLPENQNKLELLKKDNEVIFSKGNYRITLHIVLDH